MRVRHPGRGRRLDRMLRENLGRVGPAALTGLATGLAALIVMGWGLGRPAFWVDESASVLATQRDWSAVFLLLRGAEAPLVPYYLLLKLLTGVAAELVPGLEGHPEVLYRWPSAMAAALSVGLLSAWLTRRASLRLGLASGVVLLLTAALSRYGQEARPYAFTMLAAVVSTILWSRLLDDPDRRRGGAYALSVMALVGTHLVGATVVIAHLVAAVWTASPGRRASHVRWTARPAAVGVVLVSPFALVAGAYAHGPSSTQPPTPALLWATLSRLFTVGGQPLLGIGVLFGLALVGLSRTMSGGDTRIARTAAAWAVVPLLVLLPLVLARPGLLRVRYIIFTLPGWVILGGLGLLVVVELARTASAHLGAGARERRMAGVVAAGLVLILATWMQVPSLQAVRSSDGHGEDARPVFALTSLAPNATLPIVMSGTTAAIVLAAYRYEEDRLVGASIQRNGRSIWPQVQSDRQVGAELRGARRVLFLQRWNLSACPRHGPERTSAYMRRCLPRSLSRLGYQVLSTRTPGRNWSVALLGR